jgi:hypothetical protein
LPFHRLAQQAVAIGPALLHHHHRSEFVTHETGVKGMSSWHQKTGTARAQVPQKLLGFFDSDMRRQIFEFERFLFD